MTANEPVVNVKLGDIYGLLLETSETVKRLETEFRLGDFERRIEELERTRWKFMGASGVVAAGVTFLVEKLKLK